MYVPPDDLIYRIALSRVPLIGDFHARLLLDTYGNACTIFKTRRKELEKIAGIGPARAQQLVAFSDFQMCEDELRFLQQYQIKPIGYGTPDYPARLQHCSDGPALLYYKGNANLQQQRILAVVGTRRPTQYGKQVCEQIIRDLAEFSVLIVSGLAYGIDTIAHQAALKNQLPTLAVLAHGLDRIYPPQNKALARDMLESGGLITDFPKGTKPDRMHFPQRNRITAGLCDALLVIESGVQGGSLITANIANSYHKEVFAIPGPVTQSLSAGCNELIKKNQAQLVCSAQDILDFMNWGNPPAQKEAVQTTLFPAMNADESILWQWFQQHPLAHIDAILEQQAMPRQAITQALLSLEMQGLIRQEPGKIFRLL
jgi:DNA processing protein